MSEKVYYVDGAYVAAREASIPVTDLALVRGFGVFDYFRTYGGLPIQLERNVQRFRNSAAVLGMELPWTDNDITEAILGTLARNDFDEASIRVIATGGDSPDFITPQGNPRLLVYVEPLKPLPASWYINGVKVITFDEERYLPTSKSLNYIPAIIAQRAAREQGAIEALYRDRSGHVREGTTTNLFAYYGDKHIVTPEAGILPGVTRGRMMEIFVANGFTVDERPMSYDDLTRAQELIITAANKQVIPVITIDSHHYSEEPGPWSRQMMELFDVYVQARAAERDRVTTNED